LKAVAKGDGNLETIRRRQAKSGRVDYGDPVILCDSSKRRVMVVPFWAVVEEKSLSLREAEARKLQNALRAHLAVAESGEAGNFLLIRVAEGTAQLGAHDPAQVAAALMKVLVHRRIQRIHKSR
jgi:hypothetical protein